VAAKSGLEKAGNKEYQNEHMGKLFQEGFSFSGYERDGLQLSLGNKKFLNVSGVSGVDSITDGRGAVFADFDNDGDTDIFLTTIQGQAHLLFRNNVGSENSFVRVSLDGTKSGRDAYGAIVRVKTSAGTLTKSKAGGSGFLSQHDPRLLFGLGSDEKAEWIEVTWPSGIKQRFENIAAGTSLKILEGEPPYDTIREQRFELPDPVPSDQIFLTKLKVGFGSQFPDLNVSSLDGKPSTLGQTLTSGHKYLINLWATYCIPCATEMPELQRLYPSFQANNIEIIGLSLDTEGSELVSKFLAQHGVQYPIYLASETLVEQIYATDEVFIPLSFVVDDRGKVLDIFAGWSKDSVDKLLRLSTPTDGTGSGETSPPQTFGR
jgi:thiol-disulfide isomerase/thioredoxin